METDMFGQEFANPTVDEMLASYSNLPLGGYSGKTTSNKMANLAAIQKILGVDFLSAQNPDTQMAPQWLDQPNSVGEIYRNDPIAAAVFAQIEAGGDPGSAVTVALEDAGKRPETQDSITGKTYGERYIDLAQQYSVENVKRQQDRAQFDYKNQQEAANKPPSWADVHKTASQYDLMGAPSTANLFNEYAKSVRSKESAAKSKSSGGTGYAQGWKNQANIQAAMPSKLSPAETSNLSRRGTFLFKKSLDDRLNTAKQTLVRSPQNQAAMEALTRLSPLIQGGK